MLQNGPVGVHSRAVESDLAWYPYAATIPVLRVPNGETHSVVRLMLCLLAMSSAVQLPLA